MGLLQEISGALSNDNLNRLSSGQANFDDQSSLDLQSLQEMIKKIDPQQLQQILKQSAQQVAPQEYSDHVTPGVGGTNPLGNLGQAGLGAIAAALLNHLKAAGATNDASLSKDLGLQTTDPKKMNADDVAAVARYTQQNQPEAFGKAAAQIGQQQPAILHSFLGKAVLAVGAAALASHFIKTNRG